MERSVNNKTRSVERFVTLLKHLYMFVLGGGGGGGSLYKKRSLTKTKIRYRILIKNYE